MLLTVVVLKKLLSCSEDFPSLIASQTTAIKTKEFSKKSRDSTSISRLSLVSMQNCTLSSSGSRQATRDIFRGRVVAALYRAAAVQDDLLNCLSDDEAVSVGISLVRHDVSGDANLEKAAALDPLGASDVPSPSIQSEAPHNRRSKILQLIGVRRA